MSEEEENTLDPCQSENLTCLNGSYCKQGKPNLKPIHRPLGLQTHITSKLDGNHYHCKCPDGYIGYDCSVQVMECAATRDDLVHSCYYGSTCVEADNENGLLDRYCDCSAANSGGDGFLVTGLMCQYKSTALCVDDSSGEKVRDQFCANGGKCNDIVDIMASHPGCTCHHKWEGDHCEFASGVLFDDALDFFQQRQTEISSMRRGIDVMGSENSEGGSEINRIPLIVGGSLIAAATMFIILRKSKQARRRFVVENLDFVNKHFGGKSTEASYNANILLPSYSKENDYDQNIAFKISYETDDDGSKMQTCYEEDTNVVETLDDDTSRVIEARFEDNMSDESEASEDATPCMSNIAGSKYSKYATLHCEWNPSYDDDDGKEKELMRSPRITATNGYSAADSSTDVEIPSIDEYLDADGVITI
jgi:hypothetical protein